MKNYMRRRIEHTLNALAMAGACRMRTGKQPNTVWLAGPERSEHQSVILFHLRTAEWRDKKSDTTGSGLFGAMRRLGLDLTTVTSAMALASNEVPADNKEVKE